MKSYMKNEKIMPKSPKPSVFYDERIIYAYLAAAVGDALGWPFEGHSKAMPSVDQWDGNFLRWEKRSGSRFLPTSELIDTGEYSDDTQLILAVTRSRLNGGLEWWKTFAKCELPFWTLYERGGGGATKRAASSWLSSVPPWRSSKPDFARKYFAAGGNGVAMRILPHCVAGIHCDSFRPIALDIITDGVTTHGHPRALVGALVYGFALWYTLKLESTLDFGELIDAAVANASVWGEYQSVSERWHDWDKHAQEGGDYTTLWNTTVEETLGLLREANRAIQAGALALDSEVLDLIGALSPKVGGAGTVSAIAAIYFASRYAASPLEGLRRAASSVGADTDTIASMTGALLGALSDTGWLRKFIPFLQDNRYISKLAGDMAEGICTNTKETHPVRRADLLKISSELNASIHLQGMSLPNGMVVEKVSTFDFVSELGHQPYWEILTTEGLRMFVRMSRSSITHAKQNRDTQKVSNENAMEEKAGADVDVFAGLSLNVSNLENSVLFYQNILGLNVSGRSGKVVRFGHSLAFKEEPETPEGFKSVTIYFRVENLEELQRKLQAVNYPSLTDIVETPKRRAFTCADPDGYFVEIFQDKRTQ